MAAGSALGAQAQLARLQVQVLLRWGRPAEARSGALASLGHHPDDPVLLELLGESYLAEGQPRRAIPFLERACRARPGDPRASAALARALAISGSELDRALELAHLAVEASPERASYLDTLGWVHYLRGSYAQAVETLEAALGLAPGDQAIGRHLEAARRQAARAAQSTPAPGDSPREPSR